MRRWRRLPHLRETTLERNNRLVKGHVFLWPGAKDWHDLWDEDGKIVTVEE